MFQRSPLRTKSSILWKNTASFKTIYKRQVAELIEAHYRNSLELRGANIEAARNKRWSSTVIFADLSVGHPEFGYPCFTHAPRGCQYVSLAMEQD
jgi:hypothetical protein